MKLLMEIFSKYMALVKTFDILTMIFIAHTTTNNDEFST